MSLNYVKDSLRRLSEKVLEFRLVNHIGSGSGYINIKILLDGKDVASKSSMKIGTQETSQVKPYMFVTSGYGDEVLVTIKLDEPIKRDPHNVKTICDVEELGSYSVQFEKTL